MPKRAPNPHIEQQPDFLDTRAENVSEDMILQYLAQILADILTKEKESGESPIDLS